MSTLRTHDDTWDIATSVGSTAVMVAAARAAETEQPDPLISDPTPSCWSTAPAAGSLGAHARRVDGRPKLADIDPEMAAIFTHMRNYQAVRTHFFDAYFADAIAAGIRQIVILASGLDSRAYRLDWPAGTVVFEIDQPKVLEYKARDAGRARRAAAADRHEVAVDLRFDWPAALQAAGFDPAQPTAWLAEGLLMYLPADAQDRLFEQHHRAQRARQPDRRRNRGPARPRSAARRCASGSSRSPTSSASSRPLDIGDLIYNDPDRADVADWLNAPAGVRPAVAAKRRDAPA